MLELHAYSPLKATREDWSCSGYRSTITDRELTDSTADGINAALQEKTEVYDNKTIDESSSSLSLSAEVSSSNNGKPTMPLSYRQTGDLLEASKKIFSRTRPLKKSPIRQVNYNSCKEKTTISDDQTSFDLKNKSAMVVCKNIAICEDSDKALNNKTDNVLSTRMCEEGDANSN